MAYGDYIDPRMLGFNYGRGWGDDPKPGIYAQGIELGRRMAKASLEASQAAWEIDMACRGLRLSEGEEEKKRAIKRLEEVVKKYDLSVAS